MGNVGPTAATVEMRIQLVPYRAPRATMRGRLGMGGFARGRTVGGFARRRFRAMPALDGVASARHRCCAVGVAMRKALRPAGRGAEIGGAQHAAQPDHARRAALARS